MNNKHELLNENTIITPESSYTISEHDPDPLNSQRNSYTRSTIYHHDPGSRNMINAFLTRSMIYHHDSGLKSMINASLIRRMLFFYDPDLDNLRFHSRMITIENYTHGFYQIPSRR